MRKIPFLIQVNWDEHIVNFIHYYGKVYFIDNYPGIGRHSNYFFTEFTFEEWIYIVINYILTNDMKVLSKLFNFNNVNAGDLEWFRISTHVMEFSIDNVLVKLNEEY